MTVDFHICIKVPSAGREKWWVIKRDPDPERPDQFIVVKAFTRRRDAQRLADQLNAEIE